MQQHYQPIGDLLFAHAPERSAQLQRRQYRGPLAREKFDVVGQVIRFIKVPADHHHRPLQFSGNR